MKILKITTHWTPEQADTIYQFLYEFKEVIWQNYSEEIVQSYKNIHEEQQRGDNKQITPDDFDEEIPF
jgi:hypothetical protein